MRTKKKPTKKRMRTRIPEELCAFLRASDSSRSAFRPGSGGLVWRLCSFLWRRLRGRAAPKSRKPYALIFGTVWDPDGHPLYGVKVKIRRADEKKARWELYSNHTGEFAQRVPAGKADYVVWADVKGYKLPSGQKVEAGLRGNRSYRQRRALRHRSSFRLVGAAYG